MVTGATMSTTPKLILNTDNSNGGATTGSNGYAGPGSWTTDDQEKAQAGDTVRSWALIGDGLDGDFRILSMMASGTQAAFTAPTLTGPSGTSTVDVTVSSRHSLRHSQMTTFNGINGGGHFYGERYGSLIQGADQSGATFGVHYYNNFSGGSNPYMPAGINGIFMSNNNCGDFDNGPAFVGDGPLLNKVDEGTSFDPAATGTAGYNDPPYIGIDAVGAGFQTLDPQHFSRQTGRSVRLSCLVLCPPEWPVPLHLPARRLRCHGRHCCSVPPEVISQVE